MRVTLRQAIAVAAVAVAALPFAASAQEQGTLAGEPPTTLNEKTIADAYVYLLGRAVVIRQEQVDVSEEGIDYNVIKYNPLGEPLGWVNPNLDVANIEAWIAVDEDTPALLEIPRIDGRYYTAQICDEWGEVITNINERNYPDHPYGKYAFVLPGSKVPIPDGAVRIELRSPKAKMLARVEVKNDRDGAAALQRQFKIRSLGQPRIKPALPIPTFDNAKLIGVELFDHADAILLSAPDIAPVAFLAPKSGAGIPESNWLPAPDGKPFSLTFRTYVPKDIVKQGAWFPPPIVVVD